MSKSGKTTTNNRLPMLQDVPGNSQLKHLFHLAQNFAGELIELPWEVDGGIYVLSAYCPVAQGQKGIMTRKSAANTSTEWALTTQGAGDPAPQEAWRHTSADLELIENLLAVIPRSGKETTTTFFSQGVKQAQAQQAAPTQTEQQQPAASQAAEQNKAKTDAGSGMSLSGEIAELDLNGILQSINLMKMTGCLELHRSLDEVFLFFEEGSLVHALHESTLGNSKSSTGDRVLLETLLWEDGQFSFKQGKKSPDRSVNRPLDAIAKEGAALKDFWKHLLGNGCDIDATVLRRNDLAKEQYDKAVAQGLKVDLALQQAIYLDVNNKKSLNDIVSSKFNMPRSAWLPYIFNLQKLGLIRFAPKPTTAEVAQNKPLIDEMKVDKARSSLLRIESGMISYDLFLHFLQLEFERVNRYPAHFFSLIVFAIHDERTKEALSVLSVGKLTESIEQCKAKIDLLAHFREHDFVILCPYQNEQKTAALAERIGNALKQVQLEGLQAENLKLAFGVAGFPAHTQILQLLSAAEAAKDKSMQSGVLVSLADR